VRRAAPLVEGDRFFVTYGDGLTDLNLDELLAFHRAHGKLATVTVVRPQSTFGIVKVAADGRVESFDEKPLLREWVNGGFFVFERGALDYIGEDSILERAPFEDLTSDGELMAYRHEGFWECMDTFKDNVQLNELWSNGDARWKVWDE
jgi:glucose-1-phosphate cytidylyltransferase